MKRLFFLLTFSVPVLLAAQKKPLDHSVYNGWQSTGERHISNNGQYVVYTVTPQEGDATLYIRSTVDSNYIQVVPRGYNATITEDNRYAVFRIRAPYKDTREARIKKKRPDDFPKDSFALVELGTDKLWKVAKVRSYKTPQKAGGWVAYLKEKEPTPAARSNAPTQKLVDSLKRTIDSLTLLVREIKNVKGGNADAPFAEGDEPGGSANEGSELVLRNLATGKDLQFKNIADYYFNERGNVLVLRTTKAARDSASANAVVLYHLANGKRDTILKGGNDFKGFALTEDGSKLAFVAERDTAKKATTKYYSLYYYQLGEDSARLLVDKASPGMSLGATVSEHSNLNFSKSGNRLLFGTAPLPVAKDTSLIDIDLVKLDIWHYNDDYLQTQQLANLQRDLRRNYLAVYDFGANSLQQLASEALPMVIPVAEGDGAFYLAYTDTGRRVQAQWTGQVPRDVYAVNPVTGVRTLIKKNHEGQAYASPSGKYVVLYDSKLKHYHVWDGKSLKNMTAAIKVPLYDEEHDTPNNPSPYGIMAWHEADSFVYIYDKYDVWKVDPAVKKAPAKLVSGRAQKNAFRYVRVNPEERFITTGQTLYFRVQNETTKNTNIFFVTPSGKKARWITPFSQSQYQFFGKAKEADAFIYTRENYTTSPNLYYAKAAKKDFEHLTSEDISIKQLTSLNPQQEDYNWGTAELFKWTAFNGKPATGILYKPEDFDPAKKYPVLIYFYEKLTDGLFNYQAPAPTPSRLNIPFYVSRGYLVFAPDISYTKGNPGKDAYNYIVSGAQALTKKPWVDGKNMGIQGQSWGGYQVAHLITRTNMFKAAWAGAPVVNMTSAYGGIRWESGNNRQFQYEMGQSRIGANLWQRRDLYIENSPLFFLDKVKTPIVIMANDADGAVPWYQGIEMFTALRRLGKQVWMLNYNGEAHNLVERKNRKDISIRQQEYFDWLLKGAEPTRWISEGVPAVKKGLEWGLGAQF